MTADAPTSSAPEVPPSSRDAPRRPSRRVMRVVALGIVVVLGLLLGECAVRIVAPQPLSGSWREPSPAGYSVHRAGVEVRHQWRDRVVRYRFNEQRLRAGPIEDRAFRVLVLGDSFTFGWLVDEPDTFVGRLQREADQAWGPGRVQILNGGEGGWGTDCAVAFTEDAGDTIRPDAVLCFVNTWDIGRSLFTGIYEVEDEAKLTLRRGAPKPQAGRVARLLSSVPGYNWLLEHSHLAQCLRNVAVRAQTSGRENPLWDAGEPPAGAAGQNAPPPVVTPENDRRSKPAGQDPDRDHRARVMGQALFLRLDAWCRARNVPLWVATTGRPDMLPADGRGTPWGHTEATMAFRAIAPEFFAARGIEYADLIPEVSAACGGDFRKLMIPGEGHPDEEGHRVIAAAAWPHLRGWLARAVPKQVR